jgi:hypothetical protein
MICQTKLGFEGCVVLISTWGTQDLSVRKDSHCHMTGEGNCCTWWRDLKPEIQSRWKQICIFMIKSSAMLPSVAIYVYRKVCTFWVDQVIGNFDMHCWLFAWHSYQRWREICKHCLFCFSSATIWMASRQVSSFYCSFYEKHGVWILGWTQCMTSV